MLTQLYGSWKDVNMKIEHLAVDLNKRNILNSIECYEDSELYDEMSALYDELIEQICMDVDEYAFALISVDEIKECKGIDPHLVGRKAIYILLSLGNRLTEQCNKCFSENLYLKGMLLDAIADHYLFQMEHALQGDVREISKGHGVGIEKRLEVSQELPIAYQKMICDALNAEDYGISLKESYMLEPIKSMTYLLLMCEDESVFCVEHKCRDCDNRGCKMRKKEVRVLIEEPEKRELMCQNGESVSELLERAGIGISAICGHHGTCGKCRIRVRKGTLPITESDRTLLSVEELQQGVRLACKAYPTEDCVIAVESNIEKTENFSVVSDYVNTSVEPVSENTAGNYGIAIDIGTTTIAMQLVDLDTKGILDTYTALNSQRQFGADVISRIEAACKGKEEELKQCVVKDLRAGIAKLCKQLNHDQQLEKISIAANTTMMHLLLGISCETLGSYPFSPVMIERKCETMSELSDAKVELLPGISAFVGADIVAGLLACGFMEQEGISLFIDLGTNGEMVIGNKDRLLCTSTAAGPAFEGGNLSCGVGSIAGAVCGVSITEGKIELTTIGNQKPCGICGTGMVELIAELKSNHYIDETGLLIDEYFDQGFVVAKEPETIYVTQSDIREFQMAKAAIRAGVEILRMNYGCSYDQIDRVYLAGGFGYQINIEKAIEIGLLPCKLRGRINAVGNTALKGAQMDLLDLNASNIEQTLIQHAEHLSLSEMVEFQELYLDAMYLEEDQVR